MKAYQKILMLFNLILIIGSLNAERKLLFVCEEYPPYEYTKNHNPSGLDVEIIDAICTKAGIAYEIKFFPWERCVQMSKDGKADVIFGLLKNAERLTYLKYPDQALSYDKRVFISLKSYPLMIKTLSDLRGKTVGVVRGYSYSEEFDKSDIFIRDISSTSGSLIDKLDNKRYELIAINEIVAKYLIPRAKWSAYKVHPYIITSGPLYSGFALNSSYAMSLFSRYNDALNNLSNTGELTRIRNKYR